MADHGGSVRELDQTPTWAVAAVVAVIIMISIALEKLLDRLGEWFTKRRKRALFEALEKVKGELMILGFISLLLTFGQTYISGICISQELADTMLPCSPRNHLMTGEDSHAPAGEHHGTTIEHNPPSDESHPSPEGHDQPTAEHAQPTQDHSEPTDDHAEPTEQRHETEEEQHHEPEDEQHPPPEENHKRRLLWDNTSRNLDLQRRVLAGHGTGPQCGDGKVPLVSSHAIHQLHIFIFFLAVFHVVTSVLTMALGRLKIREWKQWEESTSSADYEFSNDPSRFRFAHETSFVRQHTSFWTRLRFSFYCLCFFRQFFRSIRKADYLTMRHGFIAVHLAPGTKFNFRKYIKRSLEDDFKVVVGISPALWVSALFFLLLNVDGWHMLVWVSVIPLLCLLSIGTKLQVIIMTMALEIRERHAVVQGIPLVQVSDKNFWFGRPHFVLFLIHFTLFQNAFQIIYFLWIWYEFGLDSCFHDNITLLLCRMALGAGVQFLCSYITLPLYALVSQMGTHMKQTIFDEQTSKALRKWTKAAKKKQGKTPPHSPRTLGIAASVVDGLSPEHQLHQINTKDSGDSQPIIELSRMEDEATLTPLKNSSAVPNLL